MTTAFRFETVDLRRWWDAANGNPRRAAEIACQEMERRAEAGDATAEHLLGEWTIGGCRQDLKRQFAALDVVAVPANGHARITLPGSMSVRVEGGRQTVAWEFMTHEQFDQVIAEYRAQSDVRNQRLVLFDQAAAAWDEHPEIANAADAFAAAGIDLELVVVELPA